MSNEVTQRRCRRSPTGIEDCISSGSSGGTGATGGTSGTEGPTGPEGPPGSGAIGPFETVVLASTDRLVDEDTTTLEDGTVAFVNSLEVPWTFDSTSTLAPDNITVAQPVIGPGRWLRNIGGSIKWARQPTWFVDPINGDEENDGLTALSPILSTDELSRRLVNTEIISNVSLNLLPGIAGNLILDLVIEVATVVFDINGDVSSTAPSAIDAVTPYDAATAVRGSITDAATVFTNRTRLRLTSGASAGALSYVSGLVGPNEPFVIPWGLLPDITVSNPTPTIVEPIAGDNFVVDTLNSTIERFDIRCRGQGKIILRNCKFANTSAVGSGRVENDRADRAGVRFYGCQFTTAASFEDSLGTIISSDVAQAFVASSQITFRNCIATGITSENCGNAFIGIGCCIDGGQILVRFGATVAFTSVRASDDCQFVDGAVIVGLQIKMGCCVEVSDAGYRLWGADNVYTVAAIVVEGAARLVYITKPNIPGGAVDCLIGGVVTAYAAVPTSNTARLCGIFERS